MLIEMEDSRVAAGPTLTLTKDEKTAVDLNPRSWFHLVRRRHSGSNINNAQTYQKKSDHEWLACILQPASELVVSETMYALDRDDDKWTLHDLAAHPDAVNADGNCEGLDFAHILALRFYTPGAFSSIINPLRVGCLRAKPYPFPTLMV